MGNRLQDKVAIVVGAGQTPGDTIGNGRATAILFAREGARVMLVDRRLDSAQETRAMIEKEGGEALAFELIIPSRLETIGFRLKKDSEVTQGGEAAIVIRMEPDSWLIRQLVDPMFFYVAAKPPHRLIEYRGRISVKSDDGEDQDLRVVYRYPPGG